MWERARRLWSPDTSKAARALQCHVYEKLYPWWSTSREDAPLLSQWCESAAWKLNATCGWPKKQESEPAGLLLCAQGERAARTLKGLPLSLFTAMHLCIVGGSEVEKSSGAAVWRDQGKKTKKTTTLFATPNAGRFSESALNYWLQGKASFINHRAFTGNQRS